MDRGIPFEFEAPLSFFEKANAPKGQERRIAGVLSTENMDQQQEKILQRGLDLTPFLKSGWFNDNHSRKTTDILGYPTGVQGFEKGQRLPDGDIARARTTWVEGYLLKTPKATEVWELGKALAETDRRLGFSVEGKITQRTGPERKVIAKAIVRNAAITNCPVNQDSRWMALAKSLQAVEAAEPSVLEKMLAMGESSNTTPEGPQGGDTAGQVLTGQSLDAKGAKDARGKKDKDEDDEEETAKALTYDFSPDWALERLRTRVPGATMDTLRRVLDVTRQWKQEGAL